MPPSGHPHASSANSSIVTHCLFARMPAATVVPLLPPRPTSITLRVASIV